MKTNRRDNVTSIWLVVLAAVVLLGSSKFVLPVKLCFTGALIAGAALMTWAEVTDAGTKTSEPGLLRFKVAGVLLVLIFATVLWALLRHFQTP